MTLVDLEEVFLCLIKAERKFYRDWKDLKIPYGIDEPDAGYFIEALKHRFEGDTK